MAFSGFDSRTPRTEIPGQFFTELLVQIDDLAELKLVLYLLWQQERQEGPFAYFRRSELLADPGFMRALSAGSAEREPALDRALASAVERGVLLTADQPDEPIYVLHSPKGQAALRGLAEGRWSPEPQGRLPSGLGRERPNIFQLYEQNIGPLTPMLAESLRDAEAAYSAEWIEDAIRIALENNVRKWVYVEAILKSWQEKGRDERKDQPGAGQDQRKYVEGEFSDFIER